MAEKSKTPKYNVTNEGTFSMRELITNSTGSQNPDQGRVEDLFRLYGVSEKQVKQMGKAWKRLSKNPERDFLINTKTNDFEAVQDGQLLTGVGRNKGNLKGTDIGDLIGLGNSASLLAGGMSHIYKEKEKLNKERDAALEASKDLFTIKNDINVSDIDKELMKYTVPDSKPKTPAEIDKDLIGAIGGLEQEEAASNEEASKSIIDGINDGSLFLPGVVGNYEKYGPTDLDDPNKNPLLGYKNVDPGIQAEIENQLELLKIAKKYGNVTDEEYKKALTELRNLAKTDFSKTNSSFLGTGISVGDMMSYLSKDIGEAGYLLDDLLDPWAYIGETTLASGGANKLAELSGDYSPYAAEVIATAQGLRRGELEYKPWSEYSPSTAGPEWDLWGTGTDKDGLSKDRLAEIRSRPGGYVARTGGDEYALRAPDFLGGQAPRTITKIPGALKGTMAIEEVAGKNIGRNVINPAQRYLYEKSPQWMKNFFDKTAKAGDNAASYVKGKITPTYDANKRWETFSKAKDRLQNLLKEGEISRNEFNNELQRLSKSYDDVASVVKKGEGWKIGRKNNIQPSDIPNTDVLMRDPRLKGIEYGIRQHLAPVPRSMYPSQPLTGTMDMMRGAYQTGRNPKIYEPLWQGTGRTQIGGPSGNLSGMQGPVRYSPRVSGDIPDFIIKKRGGRLSKFSKAY